MGSINRFSPLVGRILMAQIFLISGFGKITGFAGTSGYIASKGIPMPDLVTVGTILVEICGGLAVIVGWKARWGAAALFVFTGLAAAIFHNFWSVAPDMAQNQMIHFLKNITIMGGLLYIVAFGSGPVSLKK